MISKEPLRVRLTNDHDAVEALDAVHADGVPRVIERDGRPVAMIVSIEELEYPSLPTPTREGIARALALGGTWKDLGGEDLADKIHRWREESPPSPPVDR